MNPRRELVPLPSFQPRRGNQTKVPAVMTAAGRRGLVAHRRGGRLSGRLSQGLNGDKGTIKGLLLPQRTAMRITALRCARFCLVTR